MQIKSNVAFAGEGKIGVPGEKPLDAEYRTNKLNPTYDTESSNQSRPTLVGGNCFHHYAIPVPIKT